MHVPFVSRQSQSMSDKSTLDVHFVPVLLHASLQFLCFPSHKKINL